MCSTHTTHSPHARGLLLRSLSEGTRLEADSKPGCRLVSVLQSGLQGHLVADLPLPQETPLHSLPPHRPRRAALLRQSLWK